MPHAWLFIIAELYIYRPLYTYANILMLDLNMTRKTSELTALGEEFSLEFIKFLLYLDVVKMPTNVEHAWEY
jgi:hypothetical protein